jgi:hypothetical protein
MTEFDESMDRTIDEVARGMTAATAPALEARVVARLRRRSSGRPSWLAPTAVVLATASVAFLVVIRSQPATVRPPAVTSAPTLLKSAATVVSPLRAQEPRAHRPATQLVDTTTNTDSEDATWRGIGVPALSAVPDLTMAAIQPMAPAIAQLEVAPIAPAEPLVVKAIGSDR